MYPPDSTLIRNTRINCKQFINGKASEYLLQKEKYNLGDLQIIISKAFYHKGAYYVHAWELNNSTNLFHYRQTTFKFDKNKKMVDHSSVNTYQKGYNEAVKYLKYLDTPDEKSIPIVQEE